MGEVTYEMKVDDSIADKWKYSLFRHEEFVHPNGGHTIITDLVGTFDELDFAQAELRRQQRLDLAKLKK